MLSPGQFYKSVPKSLKENYLYRGYILERSKTDKAFRKGLMEACRQDFFFWCNTFAWQFNPDLRVVGPFITWERMPWLADLPDQQTQEEAVREVLDAVEAREDVRWQKSREVGASWLVLLVIVWLCVFHPNIKALVMSRNEDAVDAPDDPDSLFWKIRFIHKHLPRWMTGPLKGKNLRDPRPGIKEKVNGFSYERTHSFVNGTANVVSAGVGGRATIALIDEFGQFMNGHETYSMTSDTANCRVFVFTHKDSSGMAYDLCFDSKFSQMREIITHWTQHPLKGRGCYRYNDKRNAVEVLDKSYDFGDFKFFMEGKPMGGPFPCVRSPWYDKQCIRRTDRDVSMNLDIDPRGATDKFFDPYRIHVLTQEFCRAPVWTGTLKYDKETGTPVELVRGDEGLIHLWIQPKYHNVIPDMRYGAGVDVSAGSGATPSCLSIFSADTGQKVLEYQNALIFANEFAELIVSICRMFRDRHGNPALLCWEIQGGAAFGRRVRELDYQSVYIRRDEDSLGRPRDNKGKPGVNTGSGAAVPILNNYRDALYDRSCINHSAFAMEETLRFVHTRQGVEYRGRAKRKAEADEGSNATIHHGDVVTADALAWKMVEELGVSPKSEFKEGIPYGSLAWRRKSHDNKTREREEAWA